MSVLSTDGVKKHPLELFSEGIANVLMVAAEHPELAGIITTLDRVRDDQSTRQIIDYYRNFSVRAADDDITENSRESGRAVNVETVARGVLPQSGGDPFSESDDSSDERDTKKMKMSET